VLIAKIEELGFKTSAYPRRKRRFGSEKVPSLLIRLLLYLHIMQEMHPQKPDEFKRTASRLMYIALFPWRIQ